MGNDQIFLAVKIELNSIRIVIKLVESLNMKANKKKTRFNLNLLGEENKKISIDYINYCCCFSAFFCLEIRFLNNFRMHID